MTTVPVDWDPTTQPLMVRHVEIGLEGEEDIPPTIEEDDESDKTDSDEEETVVLQNHVTHEHKEANGSVPGGMGDGLDQQPNTFSNQNWPASSDCFLRMYSSEGQPHQTGTSFLDVNVIAPPIAPDGGWGWMIVLGSFMVMVLVDGMCFSYGILLSELEVSFSASKRDISLPGSLLTGCYLLMGPITSALANTVSIRTLIFVGSVLSTCSLFLSAFIYNLNAFIIVYGILGGIGYGLIYLPAVTIISLWFHKYRATATGIAVCGSGIGSFIYGFLVPYLIERYQWRGCLMILAGMSLNCAVAGALFRPLSISTAILETSSRPPSPMEGERPVSGVTGAHDPHMQELVRKYAAQEMANHNPGQSPPMSNNTTPSKTADVNANRDKAKAKKEKKKKKLKKPGHSFPPNSILQRTLEVKQRNKAISIGSLDNMLITSDNRLIQVPPDYNDRPMMSMNTINRIVDSVLVKQEARRTGQSRLSLVSSKVRSASTVQPHLSHISLAAKDYAFQPGENTIVIANNSASRRNSFFSSVVSLKPALDRGAMIDDDTKTEIVTKLRKEIAKPMYKKDIFYSGSMVHLQSVAAPDTKTSYVKSLSQVNDRMSEGGEEATGAAFKQAMKQLLDISILTSPTFLLLSFSSVFSMIGFIIPYQFLKDNAHHLGFSSTASSYILSYMGASNTVGRILSGLLSDFPWSDCLWVNNVALLVSGACIMAIPLCVSYAALVACGCIFGVFIAAFVSLRTIMVVELIGIDRLNNAFGFLLLFQGVAIIIGPSMLGSFYDSTKSYDYTFYLGGASLIFSAIMCFPLRHLAAWEKRRDRRRMGEADDESGIQMESK